MDINQLELLDVLVQQKSFKKAAGQCFVTTSTLTRQVTAMEAELGFPIFVRSAYGITLTEQGEVFYRETRKIVREYKAAVTNARSTDSMRRLIRVGTYGYIKKQVTHVCNALKREYPYLSFSFTSCRFTDSCSLLHSHTADLIVLGETQEADDGVFCMPVFQAYNTVITSEQHPLAEKKSIKAEELNGHTILLPKLNPRHRNRRKMKNLFSVRCPDSAILEFEHPDQADVMCMMNEAVIASISLLDVGEGMRQIRITDAPMLEIGIMCRSEDEDRLKQVMCSCREYLKTHADRDRLELIHQKQTRF